MGPPERRVSPACVQRTIQSSKNTVRTGVFIKHAVRHSINSVPKPGASLIRSHKTRSERKCPLNKASVGYGGCGGGVGTCTPGSASAMLYILARHLHSTTSLHMPGPAKQPSTILPTPCHVTPHTPCTPPPRCTAPHAPSEWCKCLGSVSMTTTDDKGGVGWCGNGRGCGGLWAGDAGGCTGLRRGGPNWTYMAPRGFIHTPIVTK